MGRKNSLAKNSIQMLCVMQHLDEKLLCIRGIFFQNLSYRK